MNADRLLKHFERISDAADAVPRLRRFVLDLAVRGKLVPQDRLYAEAATVSIPKSASAKRHRVRSQDILPQTTKDAFDFRLPDGWNAARLAEVAECLDHQREPVNSEERKARTEGKAPERLYPYYGATQQQGWIDGYLFDEPLVLLGEDGVPFLDPLKSKAYVVQGKTWVNNHAHVFRPIHIDHLFLCHWLNVFDYAGRVAGATRAKLNKSKAIDIPVPLPPLAEQHRIVAKVDELMALCDRLEAAQAEREARRDCLVSASLARVTEPDSDDATSTATSARFHLDHFARLTTRPEHVKQLRQTILNLAVRGRLVPQDNSDESAVQLLTHLRASNDARHRRVATEEGSPHEIPHSWVWACLDDLVVFGPQNGISPKPTESESAPKAITLTATTSGRFDDRYFKRVNVRVPENSEYWLSDGDLLFQRGNTREYVGIAAVYTGPPHTFLYPDLMIKVRLSPMVDLRYAHLAVTAPPARTYFGTRATGAQASMPKINQTILLSLPFPLPPLAEQRRIVAKVDELMALCDQLEASLASSATDRARLLEALLHEALAPAA